jgi:UDP-GlcNAc:undecaprenyl-phosphate GlcNAc-1-phosphate transferase
MTLPLCGALLGFLRYNFNPASIFLGDCGSLSIGFILGCFGVLWGQKSATLLGMTAPVMALAVPLLDASISIARRFLRHQPIFSGDRRHLHHRLLDMGLTHRKAVLMLYGGCGLAALFSLVQNRIHDQFGGVVVVLFCGLAWIGIQYLGYVEFGTATKLIVKGRLRKVVDAEVRLQLFEQRLNRAASLTECWETIRSGAREFGFTGVRLSCAATSLTDSFGPPEKSWQVRVPLRDDQYINFYCNFGHDRRLDLVSGFISIVEHSLTTKSILSEVSPKNPPRRGPQPLPAPAVARAVSGSA